MGLFSSKSSSKNEFNDQRGAADDGSFVATGKSKINNRVTNRTTYNVQSEEALDLTETAIRKAIDAVETTNKQADDIARIALGQAEKASESDLKEIMTVAVPLGLVVLGVYAWRSAR